ncbi:MAG: hypothetical protein EHM13_13325 [Acidobacteria bacterium]|nr:MAG: hypothetical protein EHM13_13325 [Acidobacteriota bacterium]
MRVKPVLAVGVRSVLILGAALSLAACDVVVGSLHARAQAEENWSKVYQLSQGGTVEIVNANGRIEVTGGDVKQVEVKAIIRARSSTEESAKEFLEKIEIREEAGGDLVRLETTAPRVSGSHAEVEYQVSLPGWASVRLRNTNGQVWVRGLSGNVRAETTNGGVKGEGLTGGVEASTTNGGVNLEIASVGEAGIRAETTNGGVQVSLPADAKAEVRASCVNGGISVSGLKLEGGPEPTRRRVEGNLNGGGPPVVLQTTNGGIKVTGK